MYVSILGPLTWTILEMDMRHGKKHKGHDMENLVNSTCDIRASLIEMATIVTRDSWGVDAGSQIFVSKYDHLTCY